MARPKTLQSSKQAKRLDVPPGGSKEALKFIKDNPQRCVDLRSETMDEALMAQMDAFVDSLYDAVAVPVDCTLWNDDRLLESYEVARNAVHKTVVMPLVYSDALVLIFSYLDTFYDLFHCRCVNRQWRNALKSDAARKNGKITRLRTFAKWGETSCLLDVPFKSFNQVMAYIQAERQLPYLGEDRRLQKYLIFYQTLPPLMRPEIYEPNDIRNEHIGEQFDWQEFDRDEYEEDSFCIDEEEGEDDLLPKSKVFRRSGRVLSSKLVAMSSSEDSFEPVRRKRRAEGVYRKRRAKHLNDEKDIVLYSDIESESSANDSLPSLEPPSVSKQFRDVQKSAKKKVPRKKKAKGKSDDADEDTSTPRRLSQRKADEEEQESGSSLQLFD